MLRSFTIVRKDDSASNTKATPEVVLKVDEHTLRYRENGYIDPIFLHKEKLQTRQPNHARTNSNAGVTTGDTPKPILTAVSSPAGSQDTQQDTAGANNSSRTDTNIDISQQRAAYECFIDALLHTTTSSFCFRSKALPLNHSTVLLPGESSRLYPNQTSDGNRTAIIGSFKAYMTSNGVLVVSMDVATCRGLDNLDDNKAAPTVSRSVVAAPFGLVLDSEPPAETASSMLAPTPGTQLVNSRRQSDYRSSLWKQACTSILEARGIPPVLLHDCAWSSLSLPRTKLNGSKAETTRIQETGQPISIPWPASLCFRKRALDVSSTSRVGETIMSGYVETHDPLTMAKSWFNGSAERDEKLSKRRSERANQLVPPTDSMDSQNNRPNALSPVAMRQPTTAVGTGVYPTPPDGIQHISGITPSLDGTLSSPGNPLSVPPTTETEPNALNGSPMNRHDDDDGDFADARRDSNLLDDTEAMFEDMGGDMFGDNDVTEADFNFFDEPDMDTPMEAAPEAKDTTETMDSVAKIEDEETPKAEPEAAAPPKKPVVVFAKPELRHARSSQVDEHGSTTRLRNIKRSSSPFDPDTIFKRVRASTLMASDEFSLNRPGKVFSKVDFDPKLPVLNKKYEHGGLYDFAGSSKPNPVKKEPGVLPQTNYLKRHPTLNRKPKVRTNRSNSFVKEFGDMSNSALEHPVDKAIGRQFSDQSDSDSNTDLDDSSSVDADPISPSKSSFAATGAGAADDDAVSHVTSLRDAEPTDEPDDQLARELPRLFRPDESVSLSRYFTDPEPFALDCSLSDEDLIQVAQILTDQAIIGRLNVSQQSNDGAFGKKEQPSANVHQSLRFWLHTLQGALTSALGEVSHMSLKSLLALQDIQLINQPTRVQARALAGRDAGGEGTRFGLYPIPSPHLEVRRSDAKISVLPSAVTFWENLGLAPTSGPKSVKAVCVFQNWGGMADNARTFLQRMKSIYETAKLGTHDCLPLSVEQEDGLLPYEVDRLSLSPDATMTGNGSALFESMETLRGAISELPDVDTNIVIYFVYMPRNPGTVVEACTAFQRFVESYQSTIDQGRELPAIDIVLQLISADTVTSPTEMVVAPGSELVKISMETYDRCTLFGGRMPAPAIGLEQPLPRIIDFKLTANASASLIRENGCIHVAYAQSVDGRWITAAWTDDRGIEQATSSYCMSRRGKPASRAMNDVAHEIWETTLELISAWQVHWRVVITKCAPMTAEEAEFWVDLARTEHKATVTMILLTVDTKPSLQLIPAAVEIAPHSTTIYSTPVSTPQPNILSPEAINTPATPAREAPTSALTPGGETGGDGDADCVLVDVTDQTWGAVAGHRLNNTAGLQETQPAHVSGYLVKRTGYKAEDVPSVMEVNLVHTEAGLRAYEPLLREMLSYFRSLGTLARARGMVDRDTDVRPWHVAAAEKGVHALYLLM